MNNITYITTNAKYLSNKMLGLLSKLSFGDNGRVMQYYQDFIATREDKDNSMPIVYASAGNKIIAQAVACRGYGVEWEINVYTKDKYRRQGIGSKVLSLLVKEINKSKQSKIEVVPHDRQSYKFYASRLETDRAFAKNIVEHSKTDIIEYGDYYNPW